MNQSRVVWYVVKSGGKSRGKIVDIKIVGVQKRRKKKVWIKKKVGVKKVGTKTKSR